MAGWRRQRRRLARLGVMVALVAGVATLAPAPARAQEGGTGGLRVVGQMTRPSDFYRRPMAVDEGRNLGFVHGLNPVAGGGDELSLMDLERLVSLTSVSEKSNPASLKAAGYSPETGLALDTRRQRLYTTPGYPGPGVDRCDSRLGQPVFAYGLGTDGRWALTEHWMGPMPCWGQEQFYGVTATFDQAHDRLYLGGVPGNSESWRGPPSVLYPLPELLGGPMQEDRGQALLVRQLKIEDGPLLPFVVVDNDPAFFRPAAQFGLEWGLDLRLAGCGRREPVGSQVFEGLVARLGDDVFAYCWDARPYRGLQQGQQGYLVRIPLEDRGGVMKPKTQGPEVTDPNTGDILNYVYRRVPTLPGRVTPIMDQVSGRLMLVTTDRTNGNAVWVFDPRHERFVGVITGGYADEKRGNIAVGFDSAKGRVYVLTKRGILIAPVRIDPLPAGLLYPVLANTEDTEDFVSSNRISVAPALGRLFVARNDHPNRPTTNYDPDHYEVLEDHVPDPPKVEPVDPDALTTQVTEEEGHTASSSSGQALASGVHLVNTGGLPRAVGQSDPTCYVAPPNFDPHANDQTPALPPWETASAVFGSCLPDLVVSPGHREASVAAVELEAGTGNGASARGAAFGFGSTDTGTDGDLRRVTDCGAGTPDQLDRWGRRWPFPDHASLSSAGLPTDALIAGGEENHQKGMQAYNDGRDAFWAGFVGNPQFQDGQAQYRGGCDEAQQGVADHGGPDLRAGTKGADGKGFPIPAAVCGDFGGHPSGEAFPAPSAGQPQVGYPSSSVSCDASVPQAEGVATAGALALPSAADPQLSVARVWSKVSSVRTEKGQVTMALAVAEGVTAGPLSIAQVRSLAITSAHGHTDTATATLVRQWCGIRIAEQPEDGCVDPDTQQVKDLLDELNAAALQKVQLSVPQASATATPKGYQAVVTKHPGQRGADQTVNDDDSHTVSALQAVVYNDGPRGRSRLVVQLAGVHAESRYGIIELPNFDFGSDYQAAPIEQPPVEGGPVDQPLVTTPTPAPDTFTPANFVDEGPFEVQRTFSQPAPRIVRLPSGRLPGRVVRIPVKVLGDAIQLLVQHPGEFALLFVTWALLAAPLYLGLRRRSFARALVTT